MAELTNTDALHQENESTEEMQPRRSCRPGPGAGLSVERRGPLLGRAGELQRGLRAALPSAPALTARSQPGCLGLPAVDTLSGVVFTFYKFRF